MGVLGKGRLLLRRVPPSNQKQQQNHRRGERWTLQGKIQQRRQSSVHQRQDLSLCSQRNRTIFQASRKSTNSQLRTERDIQRKSATLHQVDWALARWQQLAIPWSRLVWVQQKSSVHWFQEQQNSNHFSRHLRPNCESQRDFIQRQYLHIQRRSKFESIEGCRRGNQWKLSTHWWEMNFYRQGRLNSWCILWNSRMSNKYQKSHFKGLLLYL